MFCIAPRTEILKPLWGTCVRIYWYLQQKQQQISCLPMEFHYVILLIVSCQWEKPNAVFFIPSRWVVIRSPAKPSFIQKVPCPSGFPPETYSCYLISFIALLCWVEKKDDLPHTAGDALTAHCWPLSPWQYFAGSWSTSCLPRQPASASLAALQRAGQHAVFSGAWGCSSPGARLFISLCWILWAFC